MPDSPTPQPESDFVCDCVEWMLVACAGLPFHDEHEGKRYCVLHFPGKEKGADFKTALQRKLDKNDFKLSGVWFPEAVSFAVADFTADADFRGATFSAAANFSSATFRASTNFAGATFKSAADFRRATFSAEVIFSGASFGAEANFNSSTFKGYVKFSGDKANEVFRPTSSMDLQFARMEKPDRASFHTLTLQPHWFINVDSRKFDFTNVQWNNSGKAKPELELLIAKEASADKTPKFAAESSRRTDSDKTRKDQIKRLHRLLAIACQRLATNCEDNSRYRSASHFRRMALDR